MKIELLKNWGVRKDATPWLAKGEVVDIEKVGLSEQEAMMLIGTGRAKHIGEVTEMWGRKQDPMATPSKPGRKVTTQRARKAKPNTDS